MMMRQKVRVALLVSTYNWPEALRQVLLHVLNQTVLPDEIIIADDGSLETTRLVIDSFRNRFKIPLRHIWQHDEGFRKTSIMNQAISHSSSDYIIQIDGDILPHRHFIEDHLRVMERGVYIRGSRALLDEKRTQACLKSIRRCSLSVLKSGIRNRLNAFRIPLLSFLFIKKTERSNNVHGSNCAFWRSDFVKVNGYNNDMKGWGHEDIELAARFINTGLRQKKVKMLAIAYHLHHTYNDRRRAIINYGIYQQTVLHKLPVCSNGYAELQEYTAKSATGLE